MYQYQCRCCAAPIAVVQNPETSEYVFNVNMHHALIIQHWKRVFDTHKVCESTWIEFPQRYMQYEPGVHDAPRDCADDQLHARAQRCKEGSILWVGWVRIQGNQSFIKSGLGPQTQGSSANGGIAGVPRFMLHFQHPCHTQEGRRARTVRPQANCSLTGLL